MLLAQWLRYSRCPANTNDLATPLTKTNGKKIVAVASNKKKYGMCHSLECALKQVT